MKAIILAAGRGSRMKEATDDRPKCLVELHGKPLLEYQLDAFREAGIEDIAIVTGYKRCMLANRGLVEFYNARWSETNMVFSLACASEWLEKYVCVVSYSDIFYEASAIKSLRLCKEELAVLYDTNWQALWEKRFSDPLVDAETFRLNSQGSIIEIGKKPETIDEIEGQYMGLIRFTPKGWSQIESIRNGLVKNELDSIHMTDMLQKTVNIKNAGVFAVPYSGTWGEVDTVQDLESYQ